MLEIKSVKMFHQYQPYSNLHGISIFG